MPKNKPFALTQVVAGVVVKQDNKFLLVQEKQPKAYGKWSLPAGRADQGETLEQAAAREAKEECGFDVEIGEHLIVVHQTVEQPVLHAFAAKITGGKLVFPQHEILDARWFTRPEINKMKHKLRNPTYILGAIDVMNSL